MSGSTSGLQSENLFDQNLINLLKTDQSQLRQERRPFMRQSKSIHVTTDNSVDDAMALRYDTYGGDNRSDSMVKRDDTR